MSQPDPADVMRWVRAVEKHIRHPPELVDAVISETYTQALRAARKPVEPPRTKDVLRRLAYEFKRSLSPQRTTVPTDHVLVVPRTRPHLNQLVPIADALRAAGQHVVFFSESLAVLDAVRARGFPATGPSSSVSKLRGIRIPRGRRNVALPKLLGSATGEARILALLEAEVTTQAPVVRGVRSSVERLFRRGTRAVVVGNDLTLEGRAACLVARRWNIPSYCVAHGLGGSNPRLSATVAANWLVFGELQAEELMRHGVPPGRIEVTGAPYLDAPHESRGHEVLAALGLNGPYVLVATSGPGQKVSEQHHRRVVMALDEAAARRPDLTFVVKLHPKDRLAYYTDCRSLRIVAPDEAARLPRNIFDWLAAAELLVTGGSAVAIEAMLADVPVLTVDLNRELEDVDFIDQGATLHATGKAQLFRLLEQQQWSVPPATPRYVERKYGPRDGRSAHRAARAIMRGVVERVSR